MCAAEWSSGSSLHNKPVFSGKPSSHASRLQAVVSRLILLSQLPQTLSLERAKALQVDSVPKCAVFYIQIRYYSLNYAGVFLGFLWFVVGRA